MFVRFLSQTRGAPPAAGFTDEVPVLQMKKLYIEIIWQVF